MEIIIITSEQGITPRHSASIQCMGCVHDIHDVKDRHGAVHPAQQPPFTKIGGLSHDDHSIPSRAQIGQPCFLVIYDKC